MDLAGKVIVVTGAGSGIGRELALQLASRGADVAGVDYQADTLAETAQAVSAAGGRMSEYVLDVSDRQQVFDLPGRVIADQGGVQGIINNAGIIHAHETIEELPLEQVERVFNINWWGTYYLLKAFLPTLREQNEAYIVNVSSMGGYMPFPGQVAYGASKAAVKLLTEGLRVEFQRDPRIHVAVVYPGAVKTGITTNSPDVPEDFKQVARDASIANKEVGLTAQRAAAQVINGMERNKTRILLGGDSWFLDKLYRLMPNAAPSFMGWLIALRPDQLQGLGLKVAGETVRVLDAVDQGDFRPHHNAQLVCTPLNPGVPLLVTEAR